VSNNSTIVDKATTTIKSFVIVAAEIFHLVLFNHHYLEHL